MGNMYPILMGDVISSSKKQAQKLSEELETAVNYVNETESQYIASPLTITLGDEFQSVIENIPQAIEILFKLEEKVLYENLGFQLHYVLVEGEIDTAINHQIAHRMLGNGLTVARKMLSTKKRGRKRFQFKLENEYLTTQLTRLFEVLDGITQKWTRKDYALILDMIRFPNNQEVANIHKKTRAQIWKRRNTLMITEYNLLKTSILALVQTHG